MVSGPGRVGKQLERAAAEAQRPVVYISLREATSPHDLFFAVMAGAYSSERLGVIGSLAHSMGVWWIVLFDIIVGHEPEKTRAFNLSVVLQHMKRALRAANLNQSDNTARPLVILDHVDDLTGPVQRKDSQMQAMLTHLFAWCAATSYDDGLADIVLCSTPVQTSRRRSLESYTVERLSNARVFQERFRNM